MSPDMLTTNVYNTYYPSYVLHHHYFVFVSLLKKVKNIDSLKQFIKKASQNEVTGALFHETRRIDLKES